MPIQCSLYSKAECQTLSNALDRSKYMSLAVSRLSKAQHSLWTTSSSWVEHDDLARKPNCSGHIQLFTNRNDIIELCTSRSRTLEVQDISDIGL